MMYKCIVCICTALCLFVYAHALSTKIGIGAIFDGGDYGNFNGIFYRGFQENQLLQKHNISIQARAVPLADKSGVYSTIQSVCSFVEGRDTRVLLVVGRQETLQTVSQVAQPLGIPIVGYSTDTTVDTHVQVLQLLQHSIFQFTFPDLHLFFCN